MYRSDSVDSLSSCCRLRNELQDNTFSYTLGAGGVATGSKCVITINLSRLVQDAVWDDGLNDGASPFRSRSGRFTSTCWRSKKS